MDCSLEGEVALVTGSTDGIGAAIAREFADNGATVVVNGRSPEKAESVVAALEERGATASAVLADINDYDAVAEMVETVTERHGGLDIVVGNGAAAAGPPPRFFADTDPADLEAYCRSMFLNRMYVVKAALDPLVESEGRVVLVGSDAGRWPTPGEVGPGAASAAMMMATKVLASELARWNIQVNAVSISVTEDTPAMSWIREESPVASVFERALEKQSFPVEASDIAETALFFAGSDAASSITGQLLSVNGGISYPG